MVSRSPLRRPALSRRPCPVPRRGAFTLVELLTVSAVLVVMISVLVPTLQQAKDIAHRVQCASNLRTAGLAIWEFAGSHNGRAPGAAAWDAPSSIPITYVDILNQEHWRSERMVRLWMPPGTRRYERQKDMISCPAMRQWGGNLAVRPFMISDNVVGGSGASQAGEPGPYGAPVDVNQIRSYWRALENLEQKQIVAYSLGAMLDRFPDPTYQFLFIENERPADTFVCTATSPPYTVLLDSGSAYPPWSGAGTGVFAFRHMLPRDPVLYQTQAIANFVFLDSHVEALTPMDDITNDARDAISGS